MNLVFLLLIIVCLLIISSLIEEIIIFFQFKKIIPPGNIIKTSFGNVHLCSKGSGNKTVVILSGSQTTNPYYDFYSLQSKLSTLTKTAIYEKPGYGFSEDTTKHLSLDDIVSNLRFSLRESNLLPPYIFLCHSDSSLEVLTYYKLYPNEVSGIILEDALNPKFKNYIKVHPKILIRIVTFFKFTGLIRIVSKLPLIKNKILQTANFNKDKTNKKLFLKNIWNENIININMDLQEHCDELIKEKINLKKVPLEIITASNRDYYSNEVNDIWLKYQEEMLTWSKNSSQIIVKNTDHYIHHFDEDILIKAVSNLL